MLAGFTVLVFGMLLISPLTFISDYPPEIQAEYYRSQHKEAIKEKLTKLMLAKIITAFAFYLFYWLCCFLGTGSDKKNLAGLRSYPDAVQQAVREHPVLGKAAPQEKSAVSILLGNLIFFTIVFSALGLVLKNVLGLNDFLTAFWFFLALGEGLGVFDFVIIDLLWWRNTKRIRFSFLLEKAYYHAPSKHIGSFLRGIPLFAVVAVLSALIVAWIQ